MVRVEVVEDNRWIISALALQLTRRSEPWEEILEDCRKMGIEKCKNYVRKIWQRYGHGIGGEFGDRCLILNQISRFNALYTWRVVNTLSQVYGSGLEKSLRIIQPPFRCINSTSEILYKEALPYYEEFIEKGVPTQDARYIFNEGILTTIIYSFPKGQERYFAKIANSYIWPLQEHRELKEGIRKAIEEELGFFPDEKPLSEWKFEDEGFVWKDETYLVKNLFSSILNIPVDGSLSLYAQLVRMRQALVEMEPPVSIVLRAGYEIPPTFDDEMIEPYKEIAERASTIQRRCLKSNDPNFVYYFLLGQKAKANFHVVGANAIYVARVRSCGNAQWEIRNKVGLKIAGILNEGPRCVMERKCTEPRRKPPCPVQKIWPKLSKREIFERLKIPLRDFVIRI